MVEDIIETEQSSSDAETAHSTQSTNVDTAGSQFNQIDLTGDNGNVHPLPPVFFLYVLSDLDLLPRDFFLTELFDFLPSPFSINSYGPDYSRDEVHT